MTIASASATISRSRWLRRCSVPKCSRHGTAEQGEASERFRGALPHLGFNLSRNPPCDSNNSAVAHGRHAFSSRGNHHVRDRALERCAEGIDRELAHRADHRRLFAAWRKRWRYPFGKICVVRPGLRHGGDCSDLHRALGVGEWHCAETVAHRLARASRRFRGCGDSHRTGVALYTEQRRSCGNRNAHPALLVVHLVGGLDLFPEGQECVASVSPGRPADDLRRRASYAGGDHQR